MRSDPKQTAAVEISEWEGYLNALIRCGNMKLRADFGVDGASALNHLRAQIDDEIKTTQDRLRRLRGAVCDA